MVTDPVADMLTRIRNALIARHDFTDIPASKLKAALAEVLKREGYIRDFELRSQGIRHILRVHLAYTDSREPVITGLRRVSRPGLRVYKQADELPRVLNGLGMAVISTSRGILTDREAAAKKVGGEVLCHIW